MSNLGDISRSALSCTVSLNRSGVVFAFSFFAFAVGDVHGL